MKQIVYIYSGSRKNKIISSKVEALEFFYGYQYLQKQNFQIKIIEFEDQVNLILKLFDKIITKVISLPSSTSKICNIKNLKTLIKSDYILMVNENTAFSTLPMLVIVKILKKINVSVFVMGLYSKNLNYKILKPFHNLYIRFLTLMVDNIFLLGKGELEVARNFHRKNFSKLKYFPFSVDFNFWNKNINKKKNKEGLFFIGNDGNRDSKVILDLAKNLPQFKFNAVSKLFENEILSKNINLLVGSWATEELNDKTIRELYANSRLTLIPLKDSSQPSGQSVALQSMSAGTPVLITKTKGFWDSSLFTDYENIFFVENNDIKSWENKINEIYENFELLEKVTENAIKTISNNFNLEIFNARLLKYLNIVN